MAKRDFRRVVFLADPHCGSLVGLTPPDWQETFPEKPRSQKARRRKKLAELQRNMWSRYTAFSDKLRPVHALCCLGDMIDGKGIKAGGTEQNTTDRAEQALMAAEAIDIWDAESVIMTYGTPYHTGCNEDWEDEVAREVRAKKIGGHEWVSVNGVVFDLKHKIGSSVIPHGRHTAIARERLWNLMWAEHGAYPKADVLIRAHVHYFNYCGGAGWLALTMPALQGPGSKYGVRQCSGTVDWGLVYFDVYDDGRYKWETLTVNIEAAPVKPLKA